MFQVHHLYAIQADRQRKLIQKSPKTPLNKAIIRNVQCAATMHLGQLEHGTQKETLVSANAIKQEET